jgi:hypothetical protein
MLAVPSLIETPPNLMKHFSGLHHSGDYNLSLKMLILTARLPGQAGCI